MRKNHGEKSIRSTLCRISKWYVICSSICFFIFEILVWTLYISEENLREYCIHVPVETGAYYHFRVSEYNACLIDWMYFVREPLFVSALLYAVFICPILILWLFLRCNISSSEK